MRQTFRYLGAVILIVVLTLAGLGAVLSVENYKGEAGSGLPVSRGQTRIPSSFDVLSSGLGGTGDAYGRSILGLDDLNAISMQDVPDPSGECGITFTFFLPEAELAKRFARALNAENIRCGTVYDNSIPDRHIYSNWPFMMSGLAEDRRAPWKSPFYKGAIDGYSPTECPKSLEYLGRSIMLMIDQTFTLDDASQIVEGIRKVATALC